MREQDTMSTDKNQYIFTLAKKNIKRNENGLIHKNIKCFENVCNNTF